MIRAIYAVGYASCAEVVFRLKDGTVAIVDAWTTICLGTLIATQVIVIGATRAIPSSITISPKSTTYSGFGVGKVWSILFGSVLMSLIAHLGLRTFGSPRTLAVVNYHHDGRVFWSLTPDYLSTTEHQGSEYCPSPSEVFRVWFAGNTYQLFEGITGGTNDAMGFNTSRFGWLLVWNILRIPLLNVFVLFSIFVIAPFILYRITTLRGRFSLPNIFGLSPLHQGDRNDQTTIIDTSLLAFNLGITAVLTLGIFGFFTIYSLEKTRGSSVNNIATPWTYPFSQILLMIVIQQFQLQWFPIRAN